MPNLCSIPVDKDHQFDRALHLAYAAALGRGPPIRLGSSRLGAVGGIPPHNGHSLTFRPAVPRLRPTSQRHPAVVCTYYHYMCERTRLAHTR